MVIILLLLRGGVIGDVLFFFCSGFTLFLGRMGRIDNWYKRRINRIYPTVFAWAIMAAVLFGRTNDMKYTIISGGGWFVSCIMIYYVVLYFVQRFMLKWIKWLITVVFLGCGLWFLFTNTPSNFNMYGNTYFKWFTYFLFMLMGSLMGLEQRKYNYNFLSDTIKLLISVVLFYGIYSARLFEAYNKLQYFTLIPLGAVVFYFYKVCNSDTMAKVYERKIEGSLIKFIGGLCLEIYLVQCSLFTDKMNSLFPLNLLIMFVIIVIAAYVLRCLSRVFAQTFKDKDYDWKEVFKLI